jgi:hypothetical protein
MTTQVPTTLHTLWNPTQVPPELSDTPSFYQHLIGPNPPTASQCAEIASALEQDTELLGCSDGSYVEDSAQCTHGWLFASEIRQVIVEGNGSGHGHPALLSSYRAELGGLLALLYLVYRISTFHQVSAGSLRIICDNKSALSKAVTIAPRGITPFLTSDYDLVALIHMYSTLLPISLAGEWVKGHNTGNKL